jgi:hypothetical protein
MCAEAHKGVVETDRRDVCSARLPESASGYLNSHASLPPVLGDSKADRRAQNSQKDDATSKVREVS